MIRRLGRDFVLDVKQRSSQVRAARSRLAAISLGVAFAIFFGQYLLWRTGEWALNQFVYENQAFAINVIDVQTDGVIALDQLRRWSGVKFTENLMALDLGRVKRDLELVPAIQSAAVERILPHTLRIRVLEREPIAQINLPRRGPNGGVDFIAFQIAADGFVMLPLEARQRAIAANQTNDSLPLISGINANDLQPGRRLEASQLQPALKFIVAFEQSPMAGLVELKSIDISAPEILALKTGQGSEVVFGLNGHEQQLRRWREIFDQGQKMSRAMLWLDLAITNNIPARWLEASTVPASPPKPAKPSRTKNKHV